MAIVDTSSIIYTMLNTFTQNVTGSWYVTFLLISFIGLGIMLLFGLELEWSVIFIFPWAVFSMIWSSDYFTIGGTLVIYLGFILAKNMSLN